MIIGRVLSFQMSQSNIAGRHSYAKTVWQNSHTHTKKNMSDFDNNSNDFDDNSNEKENLEYSGVYSVTLRIHVH